MFVLKIINKMWYPNWVDIKLKFNELLIQGKKNEIYTFKIYILNY